MRYIVILRPPKREVGFSGDDLPQTEDFQGLSCERTSDRIADFGYAKINTDVTRLNCSGCCAAITYSKSGNRIWT